jgi:hypothetical protein
MAFSIEEIDNEFLARAGQFRVALDQRAFGLLLRVVSTRADTRVLKGAKIANAALDFGLSRGGEDAIGSSDYSSLARSWRVADVAL